MAKLIRTMAGITFDITYNGKYVRTYVARGQLAIALTRNTTDETWSGTLYSSSIRANIKNASEAAIIEWIREMRAEVESKQRDKMSKMLNRTRVVIRRRDNIGGMVGAYFFGVIIGAISVATSVAGKAA